MERMSGRGCKQNILVQNQGVLDHMTGARHMFCVSPFLLVVGHTVTRHPILLKLLYEENQAESRNTSD